MITSEASDAAELIRWLERRVRHLENKQPDEGSINELGTVSDTEETSDSVSATVDEDPGFTWGESAWGYDTWGE